MEEAAEVKERATSEVRGKKKGEVKSREETQKPKKKRKTTEEDEEM